MELQGDHPQTSIRDDQQAPKLQLGQLLLQNGLINEVQLLQGLHYHKTHGMRLGEALLKLEFITEWALKTTLARQLQIKMMPIDYIDLIPPTLTGYIPKEFAWKHKVCTIRKTNEQLVVVMDDPTQESVIALIQHSTRMKVSVCTAPEAVILQVLHRVYGPLEG
jgi:Type II secretion system (T2SS), protein E, N-terminal domain